MIKVYFESNSHAELVATFESEDLYIASLPALEKKAKKQGMIVTEVDLGIHDDYLDRCN